MNRKLITINQADFGRTKFTLPLCTSHIKFNPIQKCLCRSFLEKNLRSFDCALLFFTSAVTLFNCAEPTIMSMLNVTIAMSILSLK